MEKQNAKNKMYRPPDAVDMAQHPEVFARHGVGLYGLANLRNFNAELMEQTLMFPSLNL